MEKIVVIAKRISEFNIIETSKNSSYKKVTVAFEISSKKAEMIIEDNYKYNLEEKTAKIKSWHFITGDPMVDASMKIQTDFSAYDILDITVDVNDILTEAEVFFTDLKEKEKKEKEEIEKGERAAAYDRHYFLVTIKPVLEAKGHIVTCPTTKEEFISNSYKDVTLTVDQGITVGRDYHNWVEVRNNRDGNLRITKTTKSTKLEKIVGLVQEVIASDKRGMDERKEALKKKAGFKENLESVLGFEVVEKKEYHSGRFTGRRRDFSPGYEISYFVAKDETKKASCLRFTENQEYENGTYTKTISVSAIPSFADKSKLKRLVDLINE